MSPSRQDGERGIDLVQLALLGEAVAEAPDVAVFVWNDDRQYVAVNAAACALTALSREELLALRVGDLTPDRASPILEEVRRHSPLSGESRIVRRDGTVVEVAFVSFRTTLAGLPYVASVCWSR